MSDPATELFQAVIDDHRRRPRNRGPLPTANRVARRENPACGDVCVVRLRLEPDPATPGGLVAEIRFTGSGCALSQASASLMTARLAGRPGDEAASTLAQIDALLSAAPPAQDPGPDLGDLAALALVRTFPARRACALLAWQTVLDALASPPITAPTSPSVPHKPA